MITRVLIGLTVAALLPPAPSKAHGGVVAQCPAEPVMGRLIAASDLILTARLGPDTAAIVGAVTESGYVSIPLETPTVLNGAAPATLALRHYVDRQSGSANKALAAASGRTVTLFLVEADGAFYLASATQDAIRGADPATVQAVRTELARQTAILGKWRVDRHLPYFDAVERLIARLGRGTARQQEEIFASLERLGVAAVPAIVAQMDDRRSLVEKRISLLNHAPDAFEGIRHYGPQQIVDALAAILNQITGTSFGFIYNGGSDNARRAAIDAWRVYAADLSCPRAAVDQEAVASARREGMAEPLGQVRVPQGFGAA